MRSTRELTVAGTDAVLPTRFANELDSSDLVARWDNNAAARYEELSQNDDPAYRALRHSILQQLEQAGVAAGASILDAGSGLGFLAEALAEARYKIAAVEPSAVSIGFAKQGAWAEQVRWHLGTLEDFERTAGIEKFDAVIANMTLHTVANLPGFLSAANALLVSGGIVLATIPNPKTYLQSRTDINISGLDLSIEQRLFVPFRIHGRLAHPQWTPYIHRPFREYSLAAEAAGLRIDDYDIPAHIGPGRPRDVAVLVLKKR